MTTSHSEFPLNQPGRLIASLPALLGFTPEKSLVLVTLESSALGAVMRVDLTSRLADAMDRIADVVSAAKPDAAIAVVVDADCSRCMMCAEDYRRLCAQLRGLLARQGITLLAAHVVDRVEAGGRWRCADLCGACGTVDDPASSPLAMAAVLDGRRLYARREDLQEVVRVQDPARSERLAGVVAEQSSQRERDTSGMQHDRARRDVEDVMALAGRVSAGAELSDTEAAGLACALTDVIVRDTLYALAVGERAADAEALWAALSRLLPEPWRLEALALLAFSAYARGDGPLAGIALEAALRCGGEHRMASMLDTALQSGMRPEQIRELAVSGYRMAAKLGIRLPPRRAFGRRAG